MKENSGNQHKITAKNHVYIITIIYHLVIIQKLLKNKKLPNKNSINIALDILQQISDNTPDYRTILNTIINLLDLSIFDRDNSGELYSDERDTIDAACDDLKEELKEYDHIKSLSMLEQAYKFVNPLSTSDKKELIENIVKNENDIADPTLLSLVISMLPLEEQSKSLQSVMNGTSSKVKCKVILEYIYYYYY